MNKPIHARVVRLSQREVRLLPIDRVRPNPYQMRRVFTEDGMEELTLSIRQYGLLQPITVRRAADDMYELIAGERRLRACKRAGMQKVEAIILPAFELDSAVLAMIENLQRENLHFFEEAQGYKNLIREHALSQEELARRLGKSQSAVANKLRLLRLPAPVKKILWEGKLTERHARALLRLHDEKAQLKVALAIKEQGLNVKNTETLVEKALNDLYGITQEGSVKQATAYVRDVRIFLNSIKEIVQQMSLCGLEPCFEKTENEKGVEIHLLIPKTDKAFVRKEKNRRAS